MRTLVGAADHDRNLTMGDLMAVERQVQVTRRELLCAAAGTMRKATQSMRKAMRFSR